MSKFFDNKYAALTPYVPGEQPRNMSELIKLNTNENPFPPSEKAVAAAEKAARNLNLYSDPECKKLNAALANFYGLEQNQVITGNGSDELLAFCFQAFCENGAIYNDVTYGFYQVYAAVYGVKSTVIPLDENFNVNTDEYFGLHGTIFLANPNANTGVFLPVAEVEKLLLQDKDRLVVVDEAYCDFDGESCVSLLAKYDNLIVVSTMSKSRSFAGGRLGFALSNEEIISDLNKIKFSFNPYNVNSVSLAAGAAAVEDVDYFRANCNKVIENRNYLIEELAKLGFSCLPSKANFVMASGAPKISGKDYYQQLKEKGIIVRHFDSPKRIADFVRISVGTREQIEALLKATAEII